VNRYEWILLVCDDMTWPAGEKIHMGIRSFLLSHIGVSRRRFAPGSGITIIADRVDLASSALRIYDDPRCRVDERAYA